VIFTSDHGDHDASHKLEHKTMFYDEAVRVPLLVADPGCPESARGSVNRENLVQTGLDLMATVCDYLDVAKPGHNLGMSFSEPARGRSPASWREGVYGENEISYMYATDRYKFVRYDSGANSRQLYDMEADPGETRNSIGDPGMAEVASKLESALDREHARHEELSLADRAAPR
jgi:choline-sulfatase